MRSTTRGPSAVGSPRVHRLVAAVGALGLVSIALAVVVASGAPAPALDRVIFVAAAALLGDVALLHIRIGGNGLSWTFAEAALVASLVVLPSYWLAVIAPAAVGAAHLLARRSLLKVAYNAMTSATTVLLARATYVAVAGGAESADLDRLATWFGLGLAALVFTVTNGLAVSAVVACCEGVPTLAVFRRGGLMRLLCYVGNTAAALLLIGLSDIATASVALTPLLFAALYFGYRRYLRANEALGLVGPGSASPAA